MGDGDLYGAVGAGGVVVGVGDGAVDVDLEGVPEENVDVVLTTLAELETVILKASAEDFARGFVTGFFAGILIPSKVSLRCFLR